MIASFAQALINSQFYSELAGIIQLESQFKIHLAAREISYNKKCSNSKTKFY
ncbi:hypothetical protein BH09BAC4_BH09BAC4_30770 [soil metagenome]